MATTVASATPDIGLGARRRHRMVSDALVRVCCGEPVQLPVDPEVRGEFVGAVRHHRMAPLAQVRLRVTEAAIAEVLKADRDTAKAMYIRSAILLDGLDDVLGDIPWVVFKGPILSEHAHPVPGLRTYGDIDVLVSPQSIREVSRRLLEAGWQIADRDDTLRLPDTPGEMHWISPAGALVDLHWAMINMSRVRQRFSVPTDELLADRVRVPVGFSSAWTLSPADTLVHVCLHAALTGAHRMYLILDSDQLARKTDDWGAVVRQAHRWGAAPAVAVVLSRAHRVLGTPLPTNLGRLLKASAGFRVVARAADALSPVPALRQDASLAKLVARSVRPSGLQTLAALGSRAALGAINRLGRQSTPVPWSQREPATEGSLEAYLRAVEGEATDQAHRRSTRTSSRRHRNQCTDKTSYLFNV